MTIKDSQQPPGFSADMVDVGRPGEIIVFKIIILKTMKPG